MEINDFHEFGVKITFNITQTYDIFIFWIVYRRKRLCMMHMKAFIGFFSQQYFLSVEKKMSPVWQKKKSKRFAKNIQNPLLFNKGEQNMKIAIHYIYTIYVNIILLSTSKRLYMIHMNVFTAFLSRKYFITAKKKMSPVWSIFSIQLGEIYSKIIID